MGFSSYQLVLDSFNFQSSRGHRIIDLHGSMNFTDARSGWGKPRLIPICRPCFGALPRRTDGSDAGCWRFFCRQFFRFGDWMHLFVKQPVLASFVVSFFGTMMMLPFLLGHIGSYKAVFCGTMALESNFACERPWINTVHHPRRTTRGA